MHKFFNYQLGASFPKHAAKNIINGLLRITPGLGNDDAFTCRNSIGFNHDGNGLRGQISFGRYCVAKTFVGGSWNVIFTAKVFHKPFGAFKLRCGFVGAKGHNSSGGQIVNQSINQRCFGADNHKPNVVFLAELDHVARITCINIYTLGKFGDAAISRRTK